MMPFSFCCVVTANWLATTTPVAVETGPSTMTVGVVRPRFAWYVSFAPAAVASDEAVTDRPVNVHVAPMVMPPTSVTRKFQPPGIC